jgi:septum formation protein
MELRLLIKTITQFKKGKISKTLILASQSPRRRELLEQLNISFEFFSPDFIEVTRDDLSPAQEVIALARGKAESLVSRFSNHLILGCDTLVVLGSKKLGKPKDNHDALRMLGDLSGQTHQVFTGIYLLDSASGKHWEAVEETKVKMRAFSEKEAKAYVASGEPLDKAGAYGIQGAGGKLVESIQGDFYNVVGLPIKRLAKVLRGIGIRVDLRKLDDITKMRLKK